MTHFFVEFRFHGYAKRYLRGLVREVARKFRVKGAIKYRPVPHMTLFYSSSVTADIRKVLAAVEKVGEKYILVPFEVDKFEWSNGEEGKVIAAGITASPELKKLRLELQKELSKICIPHRFDTQPEFWFHSVIAFKDIDRQFGRIWHYVNTKEKPHINQYLLRITVLNQKGRIEREYDLILKRWLHRWQVIPPHGWYWWRKTINKLRELQGLPRKRRASFWERFIGYAKNIGIKKSVYLIGDTHFDHQNIIRFCNRPFRNVQEMNTKIIRNWNDTVKPRDTVYFLGDWAFGRGHKPAKYWRSKLKGHITPIRGSHDWREKGIRFEDFKVIKYHGYSFMLIHDPTQAGDWHSWIIHGHKHNNNMRDYPFINGERKTINVAVELINYRPLSLDKLLSLSIDSIRRMRTIDSEPERW
jgi:calcineurin-like phosphoesterase family protein/2'-5' RNA ligase